MFVVFGWQKEPEHIKPLLDTWCHHCGKESTWHLCSETEWLSFFFIRTFAIKREYYLQCEGCNDTYDLDKESSRQVIKLDKLSSRQSMQLHDEIVAGIEKKQLDGKSERQLNFIKSVKRSDNNSPE